MGSAVTTESWMRSRSFVLGAAACLGVSAMACGPARAEDEPKIDARTVMERINEKYEELHEQTRRVTLKYRTITRSPGKPDVYVSGTSVALQKDRKVRYEQSEDAYRVEIPGEEESAADRQGGDMLWIHDGRFLWSHYEEAGRDPDAECGVREFYVDHDRIPDEYGPKWTQPMLGAELSEEFLGHDFTLHEEILNGETVYVLRSQGRVPLSPDNSMGLTLWVDPESYLVVRMESDSAWHPSPEVEAYIDGEYDVSYDFGVPIPDSAFEFEIDEDAEDLTDVVARKIREKLEWQGKLPESSEDRPAPVAVEQKEWRCPPVG